MTPTQADSLQHVRTERGTITAKQIVADFALLHAGHPSGVVAYSASEVQEALDALVIAGKVACVGQAPEGRLWEVVAEKPKAVEKKPGQMELFK